jgi:hypothetical protein
MKTSPEFHNLADSTARRLTKATPIARSDTFFAQRAYSHFVHGVESPEGKVMDYIMGVEKRQGQKAAAERRRLEATQSKEAVVAPKARRRRKAPVAASTEDTEPTGAKKAQLRRPAPPRTKVRSGPSRGARGAVHVAREARS